MRKAKSNCIFTEKWYTCILLTRQHSTFVTRRLFNFSDDDEISLFFVNRETSNGFDGSPSPVIDKIVVFKDINASCLSIDVDTKHGTEDPEKFRKFQT